MTFWIRRFSRYAALLCFFAVVLATIDFGEPFNTFRIVIGIAKVIGACSLVWLSGFIVADIVFKGAVEDIDPERIDELEGGIAQRVRDERVHRPQSGAPV